MFELNCAAIQSQLEDFDFEDAYGIDWDAIDIEVDSFDLEDYDEPTPKVIPVHDYIPVEDVNWDEIERDVRDYFQILAIGNLKY